MVVVLIPFGCDSIRFACVWIRFAEKNSRGIRIRLGFGFGLIGFDSLWIRFVLDLLFLDPRLARDLVWMRFGFNVDSVWIRFGFVTNRQRNARNERKSKTD